MSTPRERMRLQRVGEQAEAEQLASMRGEEIANQKIQGLVQQKEAQQMRTARDQDAMQQARAYGQNEGAEAVVNGLGMGSQTIESMQQLDQVSEQAMMESAGSYVQQALQALQQGIPPQEIDAMISQNVEPELQEVVRGMLSQEMQAMQAAQQNQPQAPGQAQAPQSPITGTAQQILAETLAGPQQQQQPQQPQNMRQ